MKTPRGFIGLPALFAIIAVFLAAGGGTYWYLENRQPTPSPELQQGVQDQNRAQASTTVVLGDLGLAFDLPPGWSASTTANDSWDRKYIADALGKTVAVLECPPIPKGYEGDYTTAESDSRTFGNGGKVSYTLEDGLGPNGTSLGHAWYFSYVTQKEGGEDCVLIDGDVFSQEVLDGLKGIYGSWRAAEASQTTVPGMKKYTDVYYGFSFWYPSSWAVSTVAVKRATFSGGEIEEELAIENPATQKGIALYVVNFPSASVTTGAAGCEATYAFDSNKNGWTQKVFSCDGATNTPQAYGPAGMSTMGGLIMFSSQEGLSSVSTIVPLSWKSAERSVVLSAEGRGMYRSQELPLARTIVVSASGAAASLSAPEQVKIIQAEKNAYANQ